MKIRSNIITRANVAEALRTVPVNFINTNARDGWYEPIREFKPKGYANGFEIFLTGSSPYNAAHQSNQGGYYEKAATWDEWGVVIDRLYAVDPDAQIGHYTSQADFVERTQAEHDRIVQWHDPEGYQARSHRAPWLTEDRVRTYWEAGA